MKDIGAALHTTGDPVALAGPVRERLRILAPTVPGTIQPLEALVSDSFRDRASTLEVLSAFAALSLLLAAVGIYGVVSYTLSARTREIGIRLALGAVPRRFRRQVFLRMACVVMGGALAGMILSLALGSIMGSLLYDVSPMDPVALAAAPMILLVAASLAIGVPVIRHTRVDPVTTLRAE